MTTDTRRQLRRAVAGVLAGALSMAGAAAAASSSSAHAAPSFDLVRVEGADRYATSAAIADRFGPSTGAILASGETGRYADALSANFLAGVRGVPVLLTRRDAVPPVVLAALKRAGVREVTIVGGTDVISEAQERALRAEQLTVTRLGGDDRFATSQQVISAGQAAASPIGLVATGLDFADALGAGPLSYRGKHPMFLVRRDVVPAETLAAMRAAGTTSVIVVGGESVVGPAVVEALRAAGISVATRLAGADRSATSARVAAHLFAHGYDTTAFNVASGQNGGVDALGGAALSGRQNRALLITSTPENAGQVGTFASAHRASLTGTGLVFGGSAAVSGPVLSAVRAAAGAGSAQSFPVLTGGDGAVLVGGGTRHYTVDVGTASSVDIQLFSCSDVRIGSDGSVSFAGTNPGGTGNAAVPQDVRSTVTAVHGVAGASTDQVVPVQGVVTFTVTGDAADLCVVPVVFADPEDVDRLMLDPQGVPTTAFGVAGPVTVRATDAAAGTFGAQVVTRVDAAHDFFQIGSGTSATSLTYVPGRDVFQLAASGSTTTLTAAQFESRLSVGDTVSGLYNPTQGSTFTLTDGAPVAPAGVAVRAPQGTNAGKAGLEVTFDRSSTATVASYDVLRATAAPSSVIGQSATCPDTGSFAVVGSVARVGEQSAYVLFDASATPPSSGATTPQYCYAVRAVDAAGDVSVLSAVAGPATAVAATEPATVEPPSFVAQGTAVTGPSTLVVRFDQAVNPATVSAAGSEFRVTSTSGGISTDLPVASAAPGSTSADVVLTLSSAISGTGQITVTSRVGADGNTVCAGTGTTHCQAVGEVVLVARDLDAPTMLSAAAALNGTDNDTVTITYGEAVLPLGGTYANRQFMYEPDCDGSMNRVLGLVTQAGGSSVTLAMAEGSLPSADDPNDCVRYLDDNGSAVEDGDVVDAVGNAQVSPSTVAVPAAT